MMTSTGDFTMWFGYFLAGVLEGVFDHSKPVFSAVK